MSNVNPILANALEDWMEQRDRLDDAIRTMGAGLRAEPKPPAPPEPMGAQAPVSETTLRACPFCGWAGDAFDVLMLPYHEPSETDEKWKSIGCPSCGAAGPNASTEAGARHLWNRREGVV
jgi:hypothetical protein